MILYYHDSDTRSFLLTIIVEPKPFAFSGEDHGVLGEFGHNKIPQTFQIRSIVVVDLNLIVYISQEDVRV